MPFKRKSLYTVKDATAMAFKNQPVEFHSINLVAMTRALLARPMCYDGTILRRLRELRDENPAVYGYEVKDTENSIYKKRALKPAATIN